MTEWDVTITYDAPAPTDEQRLAALLGGGIVTAGRSPSSDRLRLGVHVDYEWSTADAGQAYRAVRFALDLTHMRIHEHGTRPPAVLAVECLTAEESERRAGRASSTGIPRLYSTKQAADRLGLHVSAIRQRAERGSIPAEKVGDAGWVFPAAAIDALAAARPRDAD